MSGVDNMEARLQKWGNSDGIRIPSNFLKMMNLKTNDIVDIVQKEDFLCFLMKDVVMILTSILQIRM